MGIIAFYEGNGASQNIVQSVNDNPGQNFRPVKNDEIRSMKLTDVRVGCKITVYDNSEGTGGDDYCETIVKKPHSNGYIVGSYESSYEDEYVKVQFVRNNGLDGKISYIRIN